MEKQWETLGERAIERVLKLEDIAEKKAKIYSRLLMSPSLAQEMESFALRHQKRKELLLEVLQGQPLKKGNEVGRYETKREEERE